MPLAPIVLFVYNRPWHTKHTVEALQKCELAAESDFYIYADGPKEDASEEVLNRIAEVRQYIHTIDGFKSINIIESPTNKGLANSVIQGVTEVIYKYGKVIVVEDDIVTHPYFLRFMNEALDIYDRNKKIYQIGASNIQIPIPLEYSKNHDCYLVHRGCSWGWGTWKTRWDNIDWNISDADSFFANKRSQEKFNRGGLDMSNMLRQQLNGQIDSWAIRWDYHMFKNKGYGLRPIQSFAYNIGMDGTGVHYSSDSAKTTQASLAELDSYSFRLEPHIKYSKEVGQLFHDFWGVEEHLMLRTRLKRRIKSVLRKYKII